MIEQTAKSKITCDTSGCHSNERRGGFVDMRQIASFIGWTRRHGKDFCPSCVREFSEREASTPDKETP